MIDDLWSDDEFRSFITGIHDGNFDTADADGGRAAFRRQALVRIAPDVQRRMLADIGVAVDASGIAHAALDILEDEMWGKRRVWLIVAPDPWSLLADIMIRRIRRSYRATVRHSDARTLAGIAKASTRAALTGDAVGEEAADSEDASRESPGG
jgi:hypothetical protein